MLTSLGKGLAKLSGLIMSLIDLKEDVGMMKVMDEGLLVTMSKHVNGTSYWITEQAMLRSLHPREIYELYCDMLIKPYKSMERAIEIKRKK